MEWETKLKLLLTRLELMLNELELVNNKLERVGRLESVASPLARSTTLERLPAVTFPAGSGPSTAGEAGGLDPAAARGNEICVA